MSIIRRLAIYAHICMQHAEAEQDLMLIVLMD